MGTGRENGNCFRGEGGREREREREDDHLIVVDVEWEVIGRHEAVVVLVRIAALLSG